MKKKCMMLLTSAAVLSVLAGCSNKNAAETAAVPAKTQGEDSENASREAEETGEAGTETKAEEKPGAAKTELVIAGGDGAGLAAAIAAVSEGMDPSAILIVESGRELAKDVAGQDGLFNAAETDEQFEAEIDDSYETFLADTLKAGENANITEMAEYMTESALEAKEWLEALGVEFGELEQAEGSSVARSYAGAGKDLSTQVAEKLTKKVEELKIPVRFGTSVTKINYSEANTVSGLELEEDGQKETIECLAVIVTDPELLPLLEETQLTGDSEGNATGLLVNSCAEALILGGKDGESESVPGLYAAGRMVEAGVHGKGALQGNGLVSMIVYGTTAGTEAAIYVGDNR